MAEVSTQGQEILIDSPDSADDSNKAALLPGGELVAWVVHRVGIWRDHRSMYYDALWQEYWRLWRGQWSIEDQNKSSERSRLIAPALSQAIETSVAEIEEAVLSREVWFDIADDIADEEKMDATLMRDQLLEDIELVDGKSVISEAVTNAAIFGQGTIKINTEILPGSKLKRNPANGALEAEDDSRFVVRWESYRPDQVIPDSSASNIQQMLGIAFEHKTPTHAVLEKIERGIYDDRALPYLGGSPIPRDVYSQEEPTAAGKTDVDVTQVIEYHGKVPLELLNRAQRNITAVDDLLDAEGRATGSSGPLVEAIVTYANDGVLLRAIINPFTMKDRSVVSFSWDKVPGRFWGRGVSEKGYNPQKALDAEMRSRADALGFVSAPMLGIDAGRIPRGFKPEVKPGKVWLTQGNPDEILRPVQIGNLEPNTFNQSRELQEMVQMGTGAFDTASVLRGQTASGGNAANAGSMLMGAFVKRSKRAIQNVDRQLMQPLIKKTAWRYLQYNQTRYPFNDTKFLVKATLGIVAREVEQLNLTQLMAMLPEDYPQVKVAVAQGIMEMSAVVNKAEIMAAMEQALQPDPEAEAHAKKLREFEAETAEQALTEQILKNNKLQAETRKLLAEAEKAEREASVAEQKIYLQAQDLQLDAERNQIDAARVEVERQRVAREANNNE